MKNLTIYEYVVVLHSDKEIILNIDEERYQMLLKALVEGDQKFIKINDGVIAPSSVAYIIRRPK
jgi:hypothetical protein